MINVRWKRMVDIKMKWEEIKSVFGWTAPKEDAKTSLGIFGGGLHVHFHISINPTFMQREKEQE